MMGHSVRTLKVSRDLGMDFCELKGVLLVDSCMCKGGEAEDCIGFGLEFTLSIE